MLLCFTQEEFIPWCAVMLHWLCRSLNYLLFCKPSAEYQIAEILMKYSERIIKDKQNFKWIGNTKKTYHNIFFLLNSNFKFFHCNACNYQIDIILLKNYASKQYRRLNTYCISSTYRVILSNSYISSKIFQNALK